MTFIISVLGVSVMFVPNVLNVIASLAFITLQYSQVPNKRGVPIIRGVGKLTKFNKRGGSEFYKRLKSL